MRHLAMALAKLESAEKRLESEYSERRMKALLAIDQEYAEARRLLHDAKESVRKRLTQHEALQEDFHWKFHNTDVHDTDVDTTNRMKRSLRREQTKRRLHAV